MFSLSPTTALIFTDYALESFRTIFPEQYSVVLPHRALTRCHPGLLLYYQSLLVLACVESFLTSSVNLMLLVQLEYAMIFKPKLFTIQ